MERAAGRLPLSATIITLNEARRVGDCIRSLAAIADEVIVVDSGSTDNTIAIARQHGAQVHRAEWRGYGPQKRLAEELCRNDWVLSLDADERVTAELAAQIRALFAKGSPARSAYRLRIVDQLPHEDVPASWAYAYERIRLYDRRAGRFADSLVHDDVMMTDEAAGIGALPGAVAHVSFQSLSSAVTKFNRYTDMQIEDLALRKRGLPSWRLLTEFPVAFVKSYIVRRRALYGWWGLILSVNFAYNRFLRVAKAYEMQKLAEREGESKLTAARRCAGGHQNDPPPNVLRLNRDS